MFFFSLSFVYHKRLGLIHIPESMVGHQVIDSALRSTHDVPTWFIYFSCLLLFLKTVVSLLRVIVTLLSLSCLTLMFPHLFSVFSFIPVLINVRAPITIGNATVFIFPHPCNFVLKSFCFLSFQHF